MNITIPPGRLRAAALATLLAGLAGVAPAASARVGWSVGIDLAPPAFAAMPYGSLGVQVGGGHGRGWRHGGYGHRPWHSHGLGVGLVLVAPPLVYALEPQPIAIAAAPAATLPVPPSRPDPVIYPRNGQDARQTEADRQACNRWATTQPAALADAGVFHRAVEACMDGRGYTMK